MSDHKTIENGFFISFEGLDCSGKSTQAKMLSNRLRDHGYMVLETREPGGTKVGEDVRFMVKHIHGEDAVRDETELFLFCASRAQLVRQVIQPFLSRGGIVVCDRFADSTTAYQGFGRGFDLKLIATLHQVATANCWPAMTFLLDLDIQSSYRRGQMRLDPLFQLDRIEEESQRFYEDVRRGFLTIAEENRQRVKILDANDNRKLLSETVWGYTANAINNLSG